MLALVTRKRSDDNEQGLIADAAAALAPLDGGMNNRKRPLVVRTQDATSLTLASQVMWKLAMKLSLHNESRLLQHLSRSMLSMGPCHKVKRWSGSCHAIVLQETHSGSLY